MSSRTTAEPMKPEAAVTKTRMRTSSVMSVAVISNNADDSRCHPLRSGHESVGAQRARPPGGGGPGALPRARLRSDDGGGNRRAGGPDGANFLQVLRR